MEKLQGIIDAVVAGNIAETKEAVRQAPGEGVTATDVSDKGAGGAATAGTTKSEKRETNRE